jgi:hypothetical protein
MHEDTRRWLLRVAFMLTCLLPTLAIAAWGVGRSLPFATRDFERHLQTVLGMQVQLGQLIHSRPRTVLLANLHFRDPETAEPVLAVGNLEAEQTPAGWRIHVPQIKLKASELDTLWATIHHRLLPAPDIESLVCEFTCDEVQIPHGDTIVSLYRLQWKREETVALHRSQLTFSLDPNSDPHSDAPQVQLLVSRNRDVRPVSTRLELNTGNVALPGWLLRVCAGGPAVGDWTLQGSLEIDWRESDWEAELRGSLHEVDVTRACQGWIPHEIAGNARLRVENARFDSQGLLSARGSAEVTGLQVATELIYSLASLRGKPIEFVPGRAPDRDAATFAADRFAVDFWVDEQGLVCRASQRDAAGLPVAVSDASGPVLLCDGMAPMFYVVWALVPGNQPDDLRMAARLHRLLPATAPRARRW